MAEPLLKRTFSKLRAKERFRRKTDPKLSGATRKVDVFQGSSSTPSSSGQAETHFPTVEESTRRSQITVSKKQNWAKLPSTCRDPIWTDSCVSLAHGSQNWDLYTRKAEVSKQPWSQGTFNENGLKSKCNLPEGELGCSRLSPDAEDGVLPDLTPVSVVCPDLSSSLARISGQGAYLQHLDRSSRAWVLSTGKSQASDEALTARIPECRQTPNGERNIWYNPIPEDDDTNANEGINQDKYEDPWRKRGMESLAKEKTPKRTGGLSHSSAHLMKDNPKDMEISLVESSDVAVVESDSISSPPVSAEGPAGLKKSPGDAGSCVTDRVKSPGTVRKLSMKMRKLPELRRKLSLRSSRNQRHGQGQGNCAGALDEASPPNTRKESSNVISRYHLDSSAPARTQRSLRPRSASKGGYLSDGDSPELLPKQGSAQGCKGSRSSPTPAALHDSPCLVDVEAFQCYCLADQPRCAQRLSGLLTVHLLGVDELQRSPRTDTTKEVFCAIQVDGVTRARTSLLTCRGTFLPLNHTFNLELERARMLKLVILTPASTGTNHETSVASGASRNRVCCLGAVAIPPLFKSSRSQQLCVRLEPRGLLYVKLTLLEQFVSSFPRHSDLPPPTVFGVELRHLVDKEESALRVPLIIQKCVCEIETRGLRVVGLYRLCGSAAVKKELRDAFEKDSVAVTLNDELYPDVNVITGILKDYLRELPSPLITKTLYEVVLEAMMVRPACRNDSDAPRSQNTVTLLQCLPEAEQATLSFLLDHLSLVASYSDSNRMTCQNLAVCFGPVLLTPTQESWQAGLTAPRSAALMGSGSGSGSARGGRSFAHSEEIASAVDFKRHIEVLHYLLQLWPVPSGRLTADSSQSRFNAEVLGSLASHSISSRREQDAGVVSRRGRGRLESPPCNRYAGDWSVCGQDFLCSDEADYDEVAGSDNEEEQEETKNKRDVWAEPGAVYMDELVLDFDAPFTCRLSLKDFDTLISDLEKELAKQINICL